MRATRGFQFGASVRVHHRGCICVLEGATLPQSGRFQSSHWVPHIPTEAKDIFLGRIPGARQGLLLALAAAVLNQVDGPMGDFLNRWPMAGEKVLDGAPTRNWVGMEVHTWDPSLWCLHRGNGTTLTSIGADRSDGDASLGLPGLCLHQHLDLCPKAALGRGGSKSGVVFNANDFGPVREGRRHRLWVKSPPRVHRSQKEESFGRGRQLKNPRGGGHYSC